MPNCFSLTRKGEEKITPLIQVDDEICRLFQVEPDPVYYFSGWVDSIGLAIALGNGLESDRMTEIFKDAPISMKILEHLRENFIANAWYQH